MSVSEISLLTFFLTLWHVHNMKMATKMAIAIIQLSQTVEVLYARIIILVYLFVHLASVRE